MLIFYCQHICLNICIYYDLYIYIHIYVLILLHSKELSLYAFLEIIHPEHEGMKGDLITQK